MKIKPRLFISYSTRDIDLTKSLNEHLVKRGYKTFFDKQSIEVGEIFPDRIISSIKKSDSCIIIVSADSVKSEWCKLESYYAHFYKKLIIPVKKGSGDYDLDSPLRYIQKDIHYAIVSDVDNIETLIMAQVCSEDWQRKRTCAICNYKLNSKAQVPITQCQRCILALVHGGLVVC